VIPREIVSANKSLGEWSIATVYRGSIAYGMYTPPTEPTSIDDKDVMAITIPPAEYYMGLKEFGSRGTKEIKQGEWDIVVYEARKFFRLLLGGNPNVLFTLWLDPKHIIKSTPQFETLVASREIFVGKHVYRSFTGYAHGQLKRMTHLAYEGYMGEKRKSLVLKFGYDTKNAAHLIRLLRMGIEFMNDGQMYVERHDAKQLLEIKRGEWSLDRVKDESTRLFALADEAYLKSRLPAAPDAKKIGELCTHIISRTLEQRSLE
jgi:predicted nucleotidyltransferase